MNTIREDLWSRQRLSWAYTAAAIALVAAAAVWPNSNAYPRLYSVAALPLLCAVLFPLSSRLVKCPRCSCEFPAGGRRRIWFGSSSLKTNFCSHCGVNLDESMPLLSTLKASDSEHAA